MNRWGHYLSKTTTKADDPETAEVNEAGTFGFDGEDGNPGILPLGGPVYLDLRAPGLRGLLALNKRKRNVAVALVVLQVCVFIRRVSHSQFP